MHATTVAAVPFFFVIWLQASVFQADTGQSVAVGEFSAVTQQDALPAGWEPLTFKNIKKHTRYALVKKDDILVLKAESILPHQDSSVKSVSIQKNILSSCGDGR